MSFIDDLKRKAEKIRATHIKLYGYLHEPEQAGDTEGATVILLEAELDSGKIDKKLENAIDNARIDEMQYVVLCPMRMKSGRMQPILKKTEYPVMKIPDEEPEPKSSPAQNGLFGVNQQTQSSPPGNSNDVFRYMQEALQARADQRLAQQQTEQYANTINALKIEKERLAQDVEALREKSQELKDALNRKEQEVDRMKLDKEREDQLTQFNHERALGEAKKENSFLSMAMQKIPDDMIGRLFGGFGEKMANGAAKDPETMMNTVLTLEEIPAMCRETIGRVWRHRNLPYIVDAFETITDAIIIHVSHVNGKESEAPEEAIAFGRQIAQAFNSTSFAEHKLPMPKQKQEPPLAYGTPVPDNEDDESESYYEDDDSIE